MHLWKKTHEDVVFACSQLKCQSCWGKQWITLALCAWALGIASVLSSQHLTLKRLRWHGLGLNGKRNAFCPLKCASPNKPVLVCFKQVAVYLATFFTTFVELEPWTEHPSGHQCCKGTWPGKGRAWKTKVVPKVSSSITFVNAVLTGLLNLMNSIFR